MGSTVAHPSDTSLTDLLIVGVIGVIVIVVRRLVRLHISLLTHADSFH